MFTLGLPCCFRLLFVASFGSSLFCCVDETQWKVYRLLRSSLVGMATLLSRLGCARHDFLEFCYSTLSLASRLGPDVLLANSSICLLLLYKYGLCLPLCWVLPAAQLSTTVSTGKAGDTGRTDPDLCELRTALSEECNSLHLLRQEIRGRAG
jgi:hypothetical protein